MTMVNPISANNAAADGPFSTRDAVLYEGDSGSAVVEVQQILNTKGFRLIVDGNFGPATKAAVLKFQRQNGLLADGIVGSTTWAALRKAIASIQLTDVCENYEPLAQPHQTAALEWLQSQIPTATLNAFARRWRNTSLPQG